MARMLGARKGGYKKSEASREHVLDAAIAVLAKKGITGTSVQDIADAAGLSKGAVHYHFESKEELLERVLDRCHEVGEARVRAVFAQPGLPLERIQRALLEMWAVRRDGARRSRGRPRSSAGRRRRRGARSRRTPRRARTARGSTTAAPATRRRPRTRSPSRGCRPRARRRPSSAAGSRANCGDGRRRWRRRASGGWR